MAEEVSVSFVPQKAVRADAQPQPMEGLDLGGSFLGKSELEFLMSRIVDHLAEKGRGWDGIHLDLLLDWATKSLRGPSDPKDAAQIAHYKQQYDLRRADRSHELLVLTQEGWIVTNRDRCEIECSERFHGFLVLFLTARGRL